MIIVFCRYHFVACLEGYYALFEYSWLFYIWVFLLVEIVDFFVNVPYL